MPHTGQELADKWTLNQVQGDGKGTDSLDFSPSLPRAGGVIDAFFTYSANSREPDNAAFLFHAEAAEFAEIGKAVTRDKCPVSGCQKQSALS